jgi:hypothetical protein
MIANKQLLRAWSQGTFLVLCLVLVSCGSNSDNSHTTATTYVSPPPHQVLTVVYKAPMEPEQRSSPDALDLGANPTKPLLLFHLENKKVFHPGEDVPIDFSIANAKLKGDGGEYRARYIVDDEEMKWVDKAESFWLAGWTPGKHTIRLELIGPDGWPYRNGPYNVVTREIEVRKE